MVEMLEGLGYPALSAPDADLALRAMSRVDRVDLLLTDFLTPGATGRRLAEQAQQRQPDLKVLIMTGYSRNAIVHQGRLDPIGANIAGPWIGTCVFFAEALADDGTEPPSGFAGKRRSARA